MGVEKLDRIEDLWIDFKYFIEDNAWVKWVTVGVVTIGIILIGYNVLGSGSEEGLEDVNTGQEEQVEVGENKEATEGEVKGVSEETAYILMNPDEFSEQEVDRAFNESLTTFDSNFVEDNVYLDTELKNGVYLYHEKVNDDFKEIEELAQELNGYGVPIYFYTPQNDQSIAGLSNQTQVIENGEVNVYAVIVREDEDLEKIETIEGAVSYLEGAIQANN